MQGPAQKMGGEMLRLGKNQSVSSTRVATPCVDDHQFLPETWHRQENLLQCAGCSHVLVFPANWMT